METAHPCRGIQEEDEENAMGPSKAPSNLPGVIPTREGYGFILALFVTANSCKRPKYAQPCRNLLYKLWPFSALNTMRLCKRLRRHRADSVGRPPGLAKERARCAPARGRKLCFVSEEPMRMRRSSTGKHQHNCITCSRGNHWGAMVGRRGR